MGIHVKKENTNAIIIYINTITRDYTRLAFASLMLPAPGKTVGTPWQRGLLRANSAKGIHVGNVHVMCINNR